MTEPTPNVPLLRQTLTYIEAHPGEWYQGAYRLEGGSCGTAYCFAGHAVVLTGGQFVNDGLVVPAGADFNDHRQWRDVEDHACEVLGMPQRECDCDYPEDCEYGPHAPELFESGNTLGDLRRIVGEICESAGGDPR